MPQQDRDDWQQVDRILEAAFDLEGDERSAFLESAFADHPRLRAEVEALLAVDARSGPLDRPVADYVSEILGRPAPASSQPEDRSGQRLGAYELLGQLGRGGMGVVYEARDTRLRRRVAIKLLPDWAASAAGREAVEREATRLARLNHPNVVTVHSAEEADGVPFLTMELVEGSSLDELVSEGRLDADRYFELANQLVAAVTAAHGRGIVHGDLKPANVMVTPEGQLKVLDFGLAELVGAEPVEVDADTDGGRGIRGTVPYMAPEQFRSHPIDQRTDLFALGAILHEMATGRRAFTGESPSEIIAAIRDRAPGSVGAARDDLPGRLDEVLARTLARERSERFGSAVELAEALAEVDAERTPATPQTPGWMRLAFAAVLAISAAVLVRQQLMPPAIPDPGTEPVLLVLPFSSADPEDAFIGQGLAAELAGRLSGVRGILVIGGESAVRMASEEVRAAGLGGAGAADYALSGSISREGASGDRLAVESRLVRLSDNQQLWADRTDDLLADPGASETSVVAGVTEALGGAAELAVGPQEPPPTRVPAAYIAYLRGLQLSTAFSDGFYLRTVEQFALAVQLDPEFGEAWARLSIARGKAVSQGLYRGDDRDAARERIRQEVAEAQRLAPGSIFTELAEGFMHYYVDRDFDRAAAIFVPLVERNPNEPNVLAAVGAIERRRGDYPASITALDRASRLDPANSGFLAALGRTLAAARYLDRAATVLDRAVEVAPDAPALLLERAALELKRTGSAAAARQILEVVPGGATYLPRIFLYENDDAGFLAALEAGEPAAGNGRPPWLMITGTALRRLGREREARARFREALAGADGMPDARRQIVSAWALAYLGRRDEALAMADRIPDFVSDDRFWGGFGAEMKAVVLAVAGARQAALDQLEKVMATPYSEAITAWDLRVDPVWDPLREEPRFIALVTADG